MTEDMIQVMHRITELKRRFGLTTSNTAETKTTEQDETSFTSLHKEALSKSSDDTVSAISEQSQSQSAALKSLLMQNSTLQSALGDQTSTLAQAQEIIKNTIKNDSVTEALNSYKSQKKQDELKTNKLIIDEILR